MNPLHWSAHAKHILIAAGILITAFFCLRAWKDGAVKMAQIESETKIRVAESQKIVAQAETGKEAAQKTIVVNDSNTTARLNELQRQLNAKPDSAQVKTIIETALPGVKTVQVTDAQGKPVLAIEDTQANRDAVNQMDVAFKTCTLKSANCEANTLQYKAIIENDKTIIGQKDLQLADYEKEVKKLKTFGKGGAWWARTGRVVIPLACAGAGAYLGANKGTKGAAIGALAGGGACALTVRF